MLLAGEQANVTDPQWQRERFRVDPLGNMLHKHTFRPCAEDAGNNHPDYAYTLHPTQGHVTGVELVDVTTHPAGTAGGPRDETRYTYDLAGRQQTSWQRVDGPDPSTGGYQMQRVQGTRSSRRGRSCCHVDANRSGPYQLRRV